MINDQYVTLQDFRLQLESVVEGIRVLNEHIEEYDKRLEGVQTSTQEIIDQVQAENHQQTKVICQALDIMHEKITNEVNSKLDIVPPSPASALTSPHVDSPRATFPAAFPNNNSSNAVTAQLNELKQSVTLLHGSIQTVAGSHTNLQNQLAAALAVPNQVQIFMNDVQARFQIDHAHEKLQSEALRATQSRLQTLWENYQKHVQNSDNNFKETAIHMDSVKKRFAEHRRTLDDLITAWKDSTTKLEALEGKFEALKDFTSKKLVPTIANLSRKSSPSGIEPSRPRASIMGSNNTQNNGPGPGGGGRGGGGGGGGGGGDDGGGGSSGGGQTNGDDGSGVADNPIEL